MVSNLDPLCRSLMSEAELTTIGWDKAPNPLRESPGARQQYMVACKELRRMFDMDEDEEDNEHAGMPCKQYHNSVDMGKLQVPLRQ